MTVQSQQRPLLLNTGLVLDHLPVVSPRPALLGSEDSRRIARLLTASLASLLTHAALVSYFEEPPSPVQSAEQTRIALNFSTTPVAPQAPPPAQSVADAPPLLPTPVVEPSSPPPEPIVQTPPPSKSLKPVAQVPPPPASKLSVTQPKPKKTLAPVEPQRPAPQLSKPKSKARIASVAQQKPKSTPPSRRAELKGNPTPRANEPVHEPAPRPVHPPLILDPRYRRPPTPPSYPQQAIRLRQQGTVLIQARISPAGDVTAVQVHQSSGHIQLDQAALAAVRRWAFVPAMHNGAAVEAWVRVPVTFALTDS